MNQLEEARLKINEIDKAMAELFSKRMEAVQQVIAYKLKTGMAIFDSSREEEVIQRNLAYIHSEHLKEYYREYILTIMSISKSYQQDILDQNKRN